MSSEPFDSCAKALPAKRSEKGYVDENGITLAPVLVSRQDVDWDQFCFSASVQLTVHFQQIKKPRLSYVLL